MVSDNKEFPNQDIEYYKSRNDMLLLCSLTAKEIYRDISEVVRYLYLCAGY